VVAERRGGEPGTLGVDFDNESYVRYYRRHTTGFKVLGFEAQALEPQLLRLMDRAGLFELEGLSPAEAIHAHLPKWPIPFLEAGVAELLSRGTIEKRGDLLLWPKYIEAQEAKQSDRVRQQESRARRRDLARQAELVTNCDSTPADTEQKVTNRDQNVTTCHTVSLQPYVHSVKDLEATPLVLSAPPNRTPARRPEVTIPEIIEAWRRICVPRGAADIREMTNSRVGKLRARIREHPTFAWWDELFTRITRSSFLFGSGNHAWKINLDWLIENDKNAVKILEGRYDDQGQARRC